MPLKIPGQTADDLYKCTRCHEFLPAERFTKHSGRSRGLQDFCKACRLKKDRARTDYNLTPKVTVKKCNDCHKVLILSPASWTRHAIVSSHCNFMLHMALLRET